MSPGIELAKQRLRVAAALEARVGFRARGAAGLAGPDIFLSYERGDADKARQIAQVLGAAGLDVWWDDALRSGDVFDEAIEQALRDAKAVIVLWSPRSVRSRWVRAEATLADRLKTFTPVMIEPCERPIIFELSHTTDLTRWDGDPSDASWCALIERLRDRVSRGSGSGEGAHAARAARDAPLDRVGIVVLPFANMSGDAEQEYFADGISEDIITDLSKVSALSVISRNSAFVFKGRNVDLPDVARQLNVEFVLEGSVRKAGNRVRVTAQLIDAAKNDHVWAERFDRDLDDIFALQDELSEAIVSALKVRLLPAEKSAIESRGTRNGKAYDLYIHARAMRSSMSVENVQRAVIPYREALLLDPDFALAWAGLASLLVQKSSLFGGPSPELEVEEAIGHATRLAPDSIEIVASRAQVCAYLRDWEGIEECIVAFEEADSVGWSFFSHLLLLVGRAQEAAERQALVVRADPLSIGASWGLQMHLDFAGRFADAIAEHERAREIHGERTPFEWLALTRAMALDRHEEVRDCFRRLGTAIAERQPFLEGVDDPLARPGQALAAMRDFIRASVDLTPLHLDSIAHWAAYLGDTDLALEAARGCFVDHLGTLLIDLWHPNFARLRPDPRFKAIVADIGLADHWRKTGRWGEFARPVGGNDFELVGAD